MIFLQHTEKSIRFYCHIHGKTEELQTEINNLKTTFGSKTKLDNGLKWSDFSSKEARKAMIIGAVLAALQQLCGCFAMLNYTAKIFQESGSNLPPNVSAIVVGIIQLFGSSFSIVLADRAGRKVRSAWLNNQFFFRNIYEFFHIFSCYTSAPRLEQHWD